MCGTSSPVYSCTEAESVSTQRNPEGDGIDVTPVGRGSMIADVVGNADLSGLSPFSYMGQSAAESLTRHDNR